MAVARGYLMSVTSSAMPKSFLSGLANRSGEQFQLSCPPRFSRAHHSAEVCIQLDYCCKDCDCDCQLRRTACVGRFWFMPSYRHFCPSRPRANLPQCCCFRLDRFNRKDSDSRVHRRKKDNTVLRDRLSFTDLTYNANSSSITSMLSSSASSTISNVIAV
jgi:hypothetical protein